MVHSARVFLEGHLSWHLYISSHLNGCSHFFIDWRSGIWECCSWLIAGDFGDIFSITFTHALSQCLEVATHSTPTITTALLIETGRNALKKNWQKWIKGDQLLILKYWLTVSCGLKSSSQENLLKHFILQEQAFCDVNFDDHEPLLQSFRHHSRFYFIALLSLRVITKYVEPHPRAFPCMWLFNVSNFMHVTLRAWGQGY